MRILLDKYFQNAYSYSLMSNPYDNVTVKDRALIISGNYRNSTYSVTVEAINTTGSVISTISLNELVVVPSLIKELSTISNLKTLSDIPFTIDLTQYFDNLDNAKTISVEVKEHDIVVPNDRISINNGIMTITPYFRNITYKVTVVVTNEAGSANSFLNVVESYGYDLRYVDEIVFGSTMSFIMQYNSTLTTFAGIGKYSGNDNVQPETNITSHIALQVDEITSISCGLNTVYAISDSTLYEWVSTPIIVAQNMKKVSGGNNFAVALGRNNALYSWGLNNYGQLGQENNTNLLVPTLIDSGSVYGKNIRDIVTGGYHCLAVDASNKLHAWGFNTDGQLGLGDILNRDIPFNITKLFDKDISAVACGEKHSLVLIDGVVYNFGYGTFTTSPVAITSLQSIDVVQIACGYCHNLVLSNDGKVYAWGYSNTYGQIGNNTTTSLANTSATTIPVVHVNYGDMVDKKIISIHAGYYSSSAVDMYGNLYVWGKNTNGQLGLGDTVNRLVPTMLNTKPIIQFRANAITSEYILVNNPVNQGSYVTFNTQQYVTINKVPKWFYGGRGLTVFVVAHFTGLGNFERIFDFGNSEGDNIILERVGLTQDIRFRIFTGSTDINVVLPNGIPSDNNPHLWVIRVQNERLAGFSGFRVEFYRDSLSSYIIQKVSESLTMRSTINNYIARSFQGNIYEILAYDYYMYYEEFEQAFNQLYNKFFGLMRVFEFNKNINVDYFPVFNDLNWTPYINETAYLAFNRATNANRTVFLWDFPFFQKNNGFTAFTAARFNNSGSNETLFNFVSEANDFSLTLQRVQTSNNISLTIRNKDVSNSVTLTNGIPLDDEFHLWIIRLTNNGSAGFKVELYLDCFTYAIEISFTNPLTFYTTYMNRIGSSMVESNALFDGDIGEILIYSNTFETILLETFASDLLMKWMNSTVLYDPKVTDAKFTSYNSPVVKTYFLEEKYTSFNSSYLTYNNSIPFFNKNGMTMFVVARFTGATAVDSEPLFEFKDANNSNNIILCRHSLSNNLFVRINNNNNLTFNNLYMVNGIPTDKSFHLWIFRVINNGTSGCIIELYLDSLSYKVSSTYSVALVPRVTSKNNIGNYVGTSTTFNGDISQILIYSKTISNTTFTDVANTFIAKWITPFSEYKLSFYNIEADSSTINHNLNKWFDYTYVFDIYGRTKYYYFKARSVVDNKLYQYRILLNGDETSLNRSFTYFQYYISNSWVNVRGNEFPIWNTKFSEYTYYVNIYMDIKFNQVPDSRFTTYGNPIVNSYVNGLKYTSFNRSLNQYMTYNRYLSFFENNTGMTAFVVARFTGTPGNWERLFEFTDANNNNDIILCRNRTYNGAYIRINNSANQTYIIEIPNGIPVDGNFHLWIMRVINNGSNGCTIELYIDSLTNKVSTTFSTPLLPRVTVNNYIGSYVGSESGSVYFSGDIGEISLYHDSMTETELMKTFNTIFNRWNMYNSISSISSFDLNMNTISLRGGSLYGVGARNINYNFGDNSNVVKNLNLRSILPSKKVLKVTTLTTNKINIALLQNGELYSWGTNDSNYCLGAGTSSTVHKIPTLILNLPLNKVVDVYAHSSHVLACTSDGKVYSWGKNDYGQLGFALITTYNAVPSLIVLGAIVDKKIIKVACGQYMSYAIDGDGKVYGWGRNDYSQLGTTSPANTPKLIDGGSILAATRIVYVVCGNAYMLALDSDGKVHGIGANDNGQLAIGTTSNSNVPVNIKINSTTVLTNIVYIYANVDSNCAVDSSGRVYIWGLTKLYAIELSIPSGIVKGKIIGAKVGATNYIWDDWGIVYGWGSSTNNLLLSNSVDTVLIANMVQILNFNNVIMNFNQNADTGFLTYGSTVPTVNSYVNDLKYTSFNRSLSQYIKYDDPIVLFENNSGITIFVVARFTSAGSYERLLDFGNGSANNNILFSRSSTSNNIYFQIYNSGVSVAVLTITNGILTDKLFHLWIVRVINKGASGFDVELYLDYLTNKVTSKSTVALIPRVTTMNYIGESNWSIDAFFNGDIGKVLVYDKSLNDTDLSSMTSDLIYTWVPIPSDTTVLLSSVTTASALRDQLYSLDLETYFNYIGTISIVTAIGTTTITDGRAYLSGNTLYIDPKYRNQTYTVKVIVSNTSGDIERSLNVTELTAPPTVKSSFIPITLSNNTVTYTLSNYFNGLSLSYAFTLTNPIGNPYNSASISNGVLTITGAYRNTTYSVTVIATNNGGELPQSISITEFTAPPTVKSTFIPITLTNNAVTYTLSNYFNGLSLSYDFTLTNPIGNPYNSASISNGVLTITGSYRNTTYSVTVRATNNGGELPQSISITEVIPAPSIIKRFDDVSFGTGTLQYTLSDYFDGVSITYSVPSYLSNVVISNGVLEIYGAYRTSIYSVEVTAQNYIGVSVKQSFWVTETEVPTVYSGIYTGYFDVEDGWFNNPKNIRRNTGYSRNFDSINSSTGGVVPNTDSTNSNNINTSVEWIGDFFARKTGNYTFYINSDDAAYFWIGPVAHSGYARSNANIQNGGNHGMIKKECTEYLVANSSYRFRIHWGNNLGPGGFEFSYKPPGYSNEFHNIGTLYY